MDGLFHDLENEAFFIKYVGEHYCSVPGEIRSVMWCKQTIDESRLRYAHREYKQNIEKFTLYLHSSNPDHYKRAGALLHALYKAGIVSGLELEANSDEVEGGVTRVRVGDAEYVLPFLKFWEVFHNQALAFDLSYGCCAAYEDQPIEYDFPYLHNVCRYLRNNPDLSIDSCFMLFVSLMKK